MLPNLPSPPPPYKLRLEIFFFAFNLSNIIQLSTHFLDTYLAMKILVTLLYENAENNEAWLATVAST